MAERYVFKSHHFILIDMTVHLCVQLTIIHPFRSNSLTFCPWPIGSASSLPLFLHSLSRRAGAERRPSLRQWLDLSHVGEGSQGPPARPPRAPWTTRCVCVRKRERRQEINRVKPAGFPGCNTRQAQPDQPVNTSRIMIDFTVRGGSLCHPPSVMVIITLFM